MIFSLSKKTIFGWEANERKKVRFKKWFFWKMEKIIPAFSSTNPERSLRRRSQGVITKGAGGEGESGYDFFPFAKNHFCMGQMREKR